MNVIDAIKKKDFKLAEQMIDAGADLTVRAENERTALMYAILSGQSASASAYAADLAMGVAGGGLVGMIMSNISPK